MSATTTPTIHSDVKLYYEKRLRELGVTEEINTISSPVYEHQGEAWVPTEEVKRKKAFELCEKGIQINYYLPTGYPIDWRKEGTKMARNFVRIRLHKERTYEKEDGSVQTAKYHQEKGSPVVPYLTPGVIDAYAKERDIETLVLVEGEFKAFKAWMGKSTLVKRDGQRQETQANDINVEFIGIPGIHGFYGGDTNHKQEINEIIQRVILDRKVKNIVLLLDADTLTLKWKPDKDLSIRPKSFANAVKNFRHSLHLLIEDDKVALRQVYFMHLKTKLQEQTKGLDDLLIQREAKTQEILKDMLDFHFSKIYFDGKMLTDGQLSAVDQYFGLKSKEEFYALYKEFIGPRPFVHKRTKYEWTGEELKYVKSEEADRFARIGINWIKRVKLPNHRGLIEERIEKWSVAEIKRDYPKHEAEQMINRDIPRYDGFFSLPCWELNEYKRQVYNCYNLMEPLIWEPKPGRFDTTLGFVKHLFGGDGTVEWDDEKEQYVEHLVKGDQFSIALDYLTILHQKPTQKTFVPCLVSKEQGTGKSTFLEWLCMIYNGNGTILNNEQFKKNFNAHWASKFIIGLDEGFLDVEKKAERERLKQMVTAKEIFLELKGIDVKPIPYFGHLIICSNDADNLMKMEEEDTRWFVVKVPPAEKKDPELEEKLKREIPAWVQYLSNRKIFHEKVDRLWFDPKDFETEQMRKIIQVTKARLDAVVDNWVKDMFLTYKVDEIRINRKTMLGFLNSPDVSKYKIDEKELKYFLEEKRKLKYYGAARCEIPLELEIWANEPKPRIKMKNEIQRHYKLRPEDWLTDEEYVEYKSAWKLDGKEPEGTSEVKDPGVGSFPEAGKLESGKDGLLPFQEI